MGILNFAFKAIKSFAKKAIPKITKVTSKSAKIGAKDTSKALILKGSKVGIANVGEKAILESAEGIAKSAKAVATEAGTQSATSVSRKIAIAGAGIFGTAIAISAGVEYDRKNGKVFNITEIKYNSDNTVRIKFSPSEEISENDKVTISNTNTVPIIEGKFNINKIISDTEIEIIVSSKITTDGNSGKMILSTTYESQLAQSIGETVKTVVDLSKPAVDEVGKGLSGTFGSLFDSLGIDTTVFKKAIIIFIILFVCFVLSFLYGKISTFYKSKENFNK